MAEMDIDARCQETSYNYGKGSKRQPYGPGGYNRCVHGAAPHVYHQDEWGNRWTRSAEGRFRTINR